MLMQHPSEPHSLSLKMEAAVFCVTKMHGVKIQKSIIIIIIIIIIIYLTATGLSPSGSGYDACT
jgi:hypothetical protein